MGPYDTNMYSVQCTLYIVQSEFRSLSLEFSQYSPKMHTVIPLIFFVF